MFSACVFVCVKADGLRRSSQRLTSPDSSGFKWWRMTAWEGDGGAGGKEGEVEDVSLVLHGGVGRY